jgi:hypothetical protein
MDKSSNNNDNVETQAVQAANQLIANYINTENYLMEDIPDLFETVEPLTSPTSSTSLSPMPELQSLPPPPPPTPSSPEPPAEKPTPVAHKDVMKKIEAEKKNKTQTNESVCQTSRHNQENEQQVDQAHTKH